MSFSLPLPSVPFSLPLSPSLPISCSRSLSLFLTHADAVVRPQSCQTRAQRWCISLRCAFDRPVARDFFSLSLSAHRFSLSIPLSLSSPPSTPNPPFMHLALSYIILHLRLLPWLAPSPSHLFSLRVRLYHPSPPHPLFRSCISLLRPCLAVYRVSPFSSLLLPLSTHRVYPLRRACNQPLRRATPRPIPTLSPFLSPSSQCLFARFSLLSMTTGDMRRSGQKLNFSNNFLRL